jgi:hypothetical protein
MTRAIATPEPGFFRMRLDHGCPWVAAIIFRPCRIEFEPETFQAVDRWPHLEAEIDGRLADVDRVWTSGRRILIAEYLFLRADRAWAREWAPQSPEANPRQSVDIGALPPIF